MAHQMRNQQLQIENDRQMREWERDATRGAVEAELQQARSELQQLRLEERGLRDRLTDCQAAQQRAEGVAASMGQSAGALPAMEAQLREHMDASAALRREVQVLSAMRKDDWVAVCKNSMAIAFVGIKSGLPARSGAWVDADA